MTVDYTVPGTMTLTTNANGNLVAEGADTFTYDGAKRAQSLGLAEGGYPLCLTG